MPVVKNLSSKSMLISMEETLLAYHETLLLAIPFVAQRLKQTLSRVHRSNATLSWWGRCSRRAAPPRVNYEWPVVATLAYKTYSRSGYVSICDGYCSCGNEEQCGCDAMAG